MFTTTYFEAKNYQQDLIRQAQKERLARGCAAQRVNDKTKKALPCQQQKNYPGKAVTLAGRG